MRMGLRVRARRQVRQLDCDGTHVQYCIGQNARMILAARLRPRGFALTVHDVRTHPGDAPSPWHQNAAQRALTLSAGVVFVHAEHLRDKLFERGLVSAPVVVIPHGVDESNPQPLPSEPALLFLGRMRLQGTVRAA